MATGRKRFDPRFHSTSKAIQVATAQFVASAWLSEALGLVKIVFETMDSNAGIAFYAPSFGSPPLPSAYRLIEETDIWIILLWCLDRDTSVSLSWQSIYIKATLGHEVQPTILNPVTPPLDQRIFLHAFSQAKKRIRAVAIGPDFQNRMNLRVPHR